MFKVNQIKDDCTLMQGVELVNNKQNTCAKIDLKLTGSLQELKINGQTIISDLKSFDDSITFASALLFPSVNSIKNGDYTVQEKQYSLDRNDDKNVLHRLVYNKIFEYVESRETNTCAAVTIAYNEEENVNGFPYKYALYLIYTVTLEGLILKALVKNEDNKSFPFNLGWHPYFYSSNLKESYLEMDSNKKLIFDTEMSSTGIKGRVVKKAINLGNSYFNDCFILNKNNVVFKTPAYSSKLSASSKENYLQVYTPTIQNVVATAPITGSANSFNNKAGLQTLKPNQVYSVNWIIEIIPYD